MEKIPVYRPTHHVRFVTASSLFDGHDASINIMRRMLQASGAEVIHLGHNRSAQEIVDVAIAEDVQGIALSSYQGGHIEFFKYCYDLLRKKSSEHIRLYGGGGGVITPPEIKELHDYGIAKIFSPHDGRTYGLQGMINYMLEQCDYSLFQQSPGALDQLQQKDVQTIARFMTWTEEYEEDDEKAIELRTQIKERKSNAPILGITGTGGAGKSSLIDELVRRFLQALPKKTVAILSVDPTKRKTGGALLGDRIRMNAIHDERVYMRSIATRQSSRELSERILDAIAVAQAAGFDLIIVETSGIGQGDAAITTVADVSLYVMTSEFGAPTQLEKIDMIDFADFIAINKFDRIGSEDALHQVQKQYQRSRMLFSEPLQSMPIYGTMASQFNDDGTNELFYDLMKSLFTKESRNELDEWWHERQGKNEKPHAIIPPERTHYLREIVTTVRQYKKRVKEQAHIARTLFQLEGTTDAMDVAGHLTAESLKQLKKTKEQYERRLDHTSKEILQKWPSLKEAYEDESYTMKVRDKEITIPLTTESLAGLRIRRVALPQFYDWGEIVRWCMEENVPGSFPYTAGVFPFKRQDEDPRRQFAGEGTPERTNARFHYLSEQDEAKRLSTAFDSVTLYGEDPDWRPDIYGKVGESGVNVCTLDDMKKLFSGFNLCDPSTSVSMTINGPAPIILAMFMNTAIDQQVDIFKKENGYTPDEKEYKRIKAKTLSTIRGTVQADILKEDQGQNTCIFSTEFALKMMGDVQQYFVNHNVRNYYSVSISGYHIAEAGANPISQLAFTLANGFTYVEYYLSRGMDIDQFAPNLSFFFSNGLDPEYTVIGRVARRIWAVVMKEKYGANERSQKLKYHIQTSGRSLHAQEMSFNDIRTTLQALMAIYDHCNSLHTNAYDEAITTPTEDSVRRAMAIQMIITKEHGLAKNENSLQGSFIIEELTNLVEEAVLLELERISDRGGVLGAMEMQYQRSKIQEESLYYEAKKHDGTLPIVGVNTYVHPNEQEENAFQMQLARATKDEKEQQIKNVHAFQQKHADETEKALQRLQQVCIVGDNIFAELLETVKVASLGQITAALYEVGGQYRRNM